MQTLWSRAAQTRCTCKCAFCHATTALSRTSASSALKRRLRFRDVFTVFYSTVLASAAVADSYVKDARRREWEIAIKEAKDELAALEVQQRNRLASLSAGPNEAKGLNGPWVIENTWDRVFDVAGVKSRERELLGFEDLVGPPLDVLKRLTIGEIEEILTDPAIVRLNSSKPGLALPNRSIWCRPKGVKKTKTLEWSVRKLVYRLLLSCETERSAAPLEGQNDGTSQARIDKTLTQTISSRIERCERSLKFIADNPEDPWLWLRLRSPTAPSYSYKAVPERTSMNYRLLTLFESYQEKSGGIVSLLSSICSLLLSTTTPPDVHFYNILITRLCQMRRMDDVQAVIDSMQECWIRPNETTLFVLLRYYTITNKRFQFFDLRKRMEGLHSRPLLLEHPNVKIPPGLQRRYLIREYSKPGISMTEEDHDLIADGGSCSDTDPGNLDPGYLERTNKVFRTARMGLMDHQVYGALIKGSLRFRWPGLAMQYYSQMVRDGFKPDTYLLTSILRYCTKNKDWDAGLAVWRELRSRTHEISRATLRLMLTLCRSLGNFVEYSEVLNYGVQLGLISPASSDSPDEVVKGAPCGSLLVSEILSFHLPSYLQISIFRDSLERAVSLIALQIASTALDLAAMDTGARKASVGFKVYMKTKRQDRHFCAAVDLRSTQDLSPSTATNVGIDLEGIIERGITPANAHLSIDSAGARYNEPESQLGKEEAQETSDNQYHAFVPTAGSALHKDLVPRQDSTIALSPREKRFRPIYSKKSYNNAPTFKNEAAQTRQLEYPELLDSQPKADPSQKTIMQLSTNFNLAGEHQDSFTDASENFLPPFGQQEGEMQVVRDNSLPCSIAISEQTMDARQQRYNPQTIAWDTVKPRVEVQKTQRSFVRPVYNPRTPPRDQTFGAQQLRSLGTSVRAVVEEDYESNVISEINFVMSKDRPSRVSRGETDDKIQPKSEDEHRGKLENTFWRSIFQRFSDDNLMNSNSIGAKDAVGTMAAFGSGKEAQYEKQFSEYTCKRPLTFLNVPHQAEINKRELKSCASLEIRQKGKLVRIQDPTISGSCATESATNPESIQPARRGGPLIRKRLYNEEEKVLYVSVISK